MAVNGQESTRALLERIKREDLAAEAAERREHEEALRSELAQLRAEIARLNAPAPLRRSTMTAAEKSQYIRARTLAEYQRLPW